MRWYRFICIVFYGVRGLILIFFPGNTSLTQGAVFGGSWPHILWGIGALIVAAWQFACWEDNTPSFMTDLSSRATVGYAFIFSLGVFLDSITRTHDLGAPLSWVFILSLHILFNFYWLVRLRHLLTILKEASNLADRILQ